jgi:hypothetical protein
MLAALHTWLVWIEIALAIFTFASLLFVTAPYGRHARSGWGPTVSAKLGWVLMECPRGPAVGRGVLHRAARDLRRFDRAHAHVDEPLRAPHVLVSADAQARRAPPRRW